MVGSGVVAVGLYGVYLGTYGVALGSRVGNVTVGQDVAFGSGVAVNIALGPLFGGSVGVGVDSATVVFCCVQAVKEKMHGITIAQTVIKDKTLFIKMSHFHDSFNHLVYIIL